MNRTLKTFCFIAAFMLFLTVGCSKDDVKPSADSLLSTDAFNRIDAIKKAYESKSTVTLQTHMEGSIAESVIKNLFFEKADLTFVPRLVRISESAVTVNLNWHGTWRTAGDRELENRGVADLVLNRETMKLIQIDGDNPFLTPVIR